MEKQIRLLRADEIECRTAAVTEKGLSILLYKDARVDQRILDETFGMFGWQRTHQCINGSLYCTVEVYDPESWRWAAKQDVGTVGNYEKEKSQASDSFKRACFNWGIGRELYTAPFIWISAQDAQIRPRDGKFYCSDHFSVASIGYNDDREIIFLQVVNDSNRRKVVYEFHSENGLEESHKSGRVQEGKTFRVYGLDLPEIKEVKPTNIPAVKANQLRLDNLFELEDETVAIVDYESKYDQADKVKYLYYLIGIANRYQKEKGKCPKLRMIVIYTGDIRRKRVSTEYDIGAVKMDIEPAFLSELDGGGILQHLEDKVRRNEMLTDEELMEMIILPLSYRKQQDKEKRIREAVDLAVQIQDRSQQVFALAGILAFTDKIIDRETANRIRRAIEMTQVAMIFEEEKQQAVETERKKAAEEAAIETMRVIANRMLKEGKLKVGEIAEFFPDLSGEDVEKIEGGDAVEEE